MLSVKLEGSPGECLDVNESSFRMHVAVGFMPAFKYRPKNSLMVLDAGITAAGSAITSTPADKTIGRRAKVIKVGDKTIGTPDKVSKVADKTTGTLDKASKVADKTTGTLDKASKVADKTTGTPDKVSNVADKTTGTLDKVSNVADKTTGRLARAFCGAKCCKKEGRRTRRKGNPQTTRISDKQVRMSGLCLFYPVNPGVFVFLLIKIALHFGRKVEHPIGLFRILHEVGKEASQIHIYKPLNFGFTIF